MLEFLFWFTIGNIFGTCISTILYNRKKTFGTLWIIHPEPNTDVYRIDIDDFDISSKKKVILRIKDDYDLSQK